MKKAIFIFFILIVFILSGAIAMAKPIESNYQQMLINNEHKLSDQYAPDSLIFLNQYLPARDTVAMQSEAAQAALTMVEDMMIAGIRGVYAQSGYRSYNLQESLNQKKINYMYYLGYEKEQAILLANQEVAAAGTSEHQSGLSLDFSTTWYRGKLLQSFASTTAGIWLANNSWQYGYILRYPENKTDKTGYIYEPWHFRYVGVHMSEYLFSSNLCMEELFSLLEKEQHVIYNSKDGNNYLIALYQQEQNQTYFGEIISISRAYADSSNKIIVIEQIPNKHLFGAGEVLSEGKALSLTSTQMVTSIPKKANSAQLNYLLLPEIYQK